MALFDDAKEALRRLESHWISLLSWLAEKEGLAADELVSQWNADEFYRASGRLAAETKGTRRAGVQWSVLHFIDFGRYSELAGFYTNQLDKLGTPPRKWRAILGQHANDGIVNYRNHTQHGNRFALLTVAEQREAVELFRAQRDCLAEWWPDHAPSVQPPPPAEGAMRAALRLLGPDPDDARPLLEQLGMRPIANPRNLIQQAGMPSELTKLGDELDALFEIGDEELGGARAAIYLARLREWHPRSAARERVRRRVSRALRERGSETLRVIILADAAGKAGDIELLLPRVRADKGVGVVRAAISTQAPTRHHVQLLESLALDGTTSLPQLTRRWIEAFSVETVTKRFYEEFRELRDRLVAELRRCNPNIPELQGDPKKNRDLDVELHAFGTRQLSRILFLWFLQQKRWLGGSSAGDGNPNFLTDLFRDHVGEDDTYFSDVLVPIFFDGLGRRLADPRHRAIEATVGPLPHLGGGIFTIGSSEFEARVFAIDDDGTPSRRVVLPDDLFDPRKDESDGHVARGVTRNRTVLGLLRGYRFTTQESTPDDQSVDPDPELLGKVFENLYQADERHATGAYYTPREIVQFMCRRTLDGYLRSKTNVDQSTIDWLRDEATDWTASARKLPHGEASAIVDALDSVRVVDPAVGSGAFLLMMMHEIITLKRGIEQSDSDRDVAQSSVDVADWKRRIATDSLYGVDINPMAVEICHLRLWLSIIVDLEVSNFRHIPTLPNLDFRIVAGDSLIDRMAGQRFEESLPLPEVEQIDLLTHHVVAAAQKQIEALKLKWANEGAANADQKRMRALRNQIREKQLEVVKVQVEHAIRVTKDDLAMYQGPRPRPSTKKLVAQKTAHLANAEALLARLNDRTSYQKPFLWPVNFHDVFEERGGFDIVLANPPYIRSQIRDKSDKATYQRSFPEVHDTGADRLVYFYGRALQVLRNGGHLAFITSNTFVKKVYGKKLRSELVRALSIDFSIDFGEVKVFDATVEPYVLTGRKMAPTQEHVVRGINAYPLMVKLGQVRSSVAAAREIIAVHLGQFVLTDADEVLQSAWAEGDWLIEPPAVIGLFRKLLQAGTPLKKYYPDFHINSGIKTGWNFVPGLILDASTRDTLAAADKRSGSMIRPWLRAQDLTRWHAKFNGYYLVWLRSSNDSDCIHSWRSETPAKAERMFAREMPALYEHLRRHKSDLEKRTARGKYWWELRSSRVYDDMFKPKVVWPDIARTIRFAWEPDGVALDYTAFFEKTLEPWLIPLLNSEVGEFLLCNLANVVPGGFLRLSTDTMDRFPIPAASDADKRRAVSLLESKNARDAALDVAANAYAVQAFDLGADDLALINDWRRRRSVRQYVAEVEDRPPDDEGEDEDAQYEE